VKRFYLALCVVGFLLPYWQFVPWVAEHGLNLSLFAHDLFANRISSFFGWMFWFLQWCSGSLSL